MTQLLKAFFFSTICITLVGSSAFAQPDLSKLKKDKDSDYEAESFTAHFLMNQISGIEDEMELSALSSGYNIHFHFNKRFGESRLSFSPGIGFNVRNYYSNVHIWSADSVAKVTVLPDSVDYSKNRLGMYSMSVPLEIRYYSKPNSKDNFFSLALGLTGEWVYTVETKQVVGELNTRIQGRDDLQEVNSLRYGAHLRLGYGKVGFYGYYGLNELFSDEGPEGYAPWAVGIKLIFF